MFDKNKKNTLAAASTGAALGLLGAGAGDISDPTTPIGLVFVILAAVLKFFAAKEDK